MDVGSALNTGLQGMQNSQQRITEAATEIAKAGTKPAQEVEPVQDVAQPLVEMKIDQLVFDASAQVVSTADETIGALLDTRA